MHWIQTALSYSFEKCNKSDHWINELNWINLICEQVFHSQAGFVNLVSWFTEKIWLKNYLFTNVLICSQFVFHGRKKGVQNIMRVSKWWQFSFWVNHPILKCQLFIWNKVHFNTYIATGVGRNLWTAGKSLCHLWTIYIYIYIISFFIYIFFSFSGQLFCAEVNLKK